MPSIFAATCREKGKRESRKAFFHSSAKKELLEREKVSATAFFTLTTAFHSSATALFALTCSSYVYIFLLYITTNTTKFQMTVKEKTAFWLREVERTALSGGARRKMNAYRYRVRQVA